MVGKKLGHYRLVEKIGQAGRGEVYRTRDERLKCDCSAEAVPGGYRDSRSCPQALPQRSPDAYRARLSLHRSRIRFRHSGRPDFPVGKKDDGMALVDMLADERATSKQIPPISERLTPGGWQCL